MQPRDESSRERFERMRRDIAARLRPVCAAMPEQEFEELVDRVARINMKYDHRRTEDLFDPGERPPREPRENDP